MISIGKFSMLAGVTTKTLRHYDKLNLLKPKHINAENGYRFYDTSQIRDILMICKLKQYNFSLDEISDIVFSDDNKFLLDSLIKKEIALKNEVAKFEELNNQISADIKKLENGGTIMNNMDKINVVVVDRPSQNIAFIREIFGIADFGKIFGKLFEAVYHDKYTILGCPIAIYHDEEFNPESNDTEIAIPVKETGENTRVLAGGKHAKATHLGAYGSLPATYGKIMEWVEANNYKVVGAPFEEYLVGMDKEQDPNKWVTDVFFPVEEK